MSYQPLVYREHGGNVLVVKGFDGGVIKGTTSAGATPGQAATITTFTATATFSTAIAGRINSVITSLKGVGILATG